MATLLLAGVLAAPGCESTMEPQGQTGVTGVYAWRTLEAELDDSYRVPALAAASEAALRDRGYAVVQRTTTADRARVEAQAPRDGSLDKVVAESHVTAAGTKIKVRVEPFGDEQASRAIMDAILVRLGR